jgi:hypothetical protein
VSRERTIQQQYPLGALGGRPLSIAAAIAAPLYTILMVYQNRDDINSPLLALASLVLTTTASMTMVVTTSSLRAPLTRQTAGFVVLWGVAGMVLGAASMWGTDSYVRDDWGSTAVGVLILSLCAYRPVRELVLYGATSGVIAATLAVLQAPTLDSGAPALVVMLVTITPIIAFTIAAAVFAKSLLDGIARWRRTARVAVTALDDAEWIARSVQQDRVTILNRDIVPFFAELLQSETVTDADRERAHEIASAMRTAMVAEADRGWLHSVVDQALTPDDRGLIDEVADDGRLAERMSIDQRSALRALIVAVCAHPDFSAHGFRIVARREGSAVAIELTARILATDQRMRSELAPYFAVLRILFSGLVVEFVQPVLALKLFYDD